MKHVAMVLLLGVCAVAQTEKRGDIGIFPTTNVCVNGTGGKALATTNGLVPACDAFEIDVPAIEIESKIDPPICLPNCSNGMCWDCTMIVSKKRWTCADKSRILLTAEDGTKHCLKFTKTRSEVQP